jgi:4-hydroxy-3-polyprenylbenzoate decarboxylase
MRNIGTYRMQVYDRRTTGMHWQRHKGGAQHYRVAERLGRRMPVSVALGADPALPFAATAPMPEGLDELLLAGFLRRERVELVKCVTNDLEVPANAQIVLEGYVDPGERRREGPFGDHTGFYSHPDDYPVFHLTCVTHRRNPIYLTTVVGIPPMGTSISGRRASASSCRSSGRRSPRSSTCRFPQRASSTTSSSSRSTSATRATRARS